MPDKKTKLVSLRVPFELWEWARKTAFYQDNSINTVILNSMRSLRTSIYDMSRGTEINIKNKSIDGDDVIS